MHRNLIETVMGGVVLVVALFFLVFAYTSADLGSVEGYGVTARFPSVEGLTVGSDVRISGVKVGSVVSHELDPLTFLVEVRMSIDESIELPIDTAAIIASESLLGGKFMRLEPGGDEELITPGGEIEYTQAPVNLEDLIGRFIYGSQSDGG